MLEQLDSTFPILTCLLFFPLAGAAVLWLFDDEDMVRTSALTIALVELALAVFVLMRFVPDSPAMASANDLLSVFITLEFSTFGFYVLVSYLREDVASNEAGLKFFILGVFAAGLLAYGISLVYGETGQLVFSQMKSLQPTPGLIIGFLLIFGALGFKIGAVPFHSWIPDTYHGSPTPVTAFLSIAPKGAAFAILLRMFFVALGSFKPTWVLLMVGASILSMTYGNIVAIAQKNMKRLLAYSGIAQIGNVLIGMAAGTKMGNDAILFYLLTYLFANLGAFAVIIAVGQAIGSEEIDDYSGLGRRSPFLAFSMSRAPVASFKNHSLLNCWPAR